MKTLKLKNTINGTSLQNPNCPPGRSGPEAQTYEITNIPDGVQTSDVIRLWTQTCNLTWLGQQPDKCILERGRFVFDYSELGVGKMIFA